jgi:hypothetical protein
MSKRKAPQREDDHRPPTVSVSGRLAIELDGRKVPITPAGVAKVLAALGALAIAFARLRALGVL